MTETEIWTKWESQIVNGSFPLRRFLGRSNHSVVFLTECRAQNLANAAIKIIPEDRARAESQLSSWQLAAALSHPHLIRVLESGRCKLGGHPFLFVVTEYAEQNLAQILPHRALTLQEVREMLIPTLDALAFLHRQNLVHGRLQPPNFLVVNDQLKLASDTIRPADDAAGINPAADLQALGATIVEALTRIRPAIETGAGTLSLPATLSPALADAVRRCLSPEPGNRPTVSELRALIDPALEASAPAVSAIQELAPAEPDRPQPAPAAAEDRTIVPPDAPGLAESTRPRFAPRLIPAAAVGLVLLAVWGGNRMLRSHAEPAQIAIPTPARQSYAPEAAPAPAMTRSPASPSVASPSVASPSAASRSAASPVVHEELPAVSRSARESIHGQIKVAVRVTVDRAGAVVGESLEIHGSSAYFARLAGEAARRWQFAPADSQSQREWLVQFEFSRDGVTGHAVPRVRQ